jgi:hypothetical protein
MRNLGLAAVIATLAVLTSCKHTVKVEPVRIEPIHLTVDLNIKVDRKLDEFFTYDKEGSEPQDEADPDREGAT